MELLWVSKVEWTATPGGLWWHSSLSSCSTTLKLPESCSPTTCFLSLSPQTLYSTLPALLDSNPFTAGAELPGPGAELEAMPPGLKPTLGVFQAALELTSQCELHPDLVSQTFGYLFFFSNASLLNSLMERGEGTHLWVLWTIAAGPKFKKGSGRSNGSTIHCPSYPPITGQSRPFYQWSRAVQIRTNLDLVLDWLQGAGLGDIATEFFRKLSTTVNLLCVPRTSLLKVIPGSST
jgi:hypothetical protein